MRWFFMSMVIRYQLKKLILFFVLGVLILALVPFESSSAYEVSTVAEGGTITGKILFKGEVPEPKKLLITKDEAVCGKGSVTRQEVSVSQDGALKDVVVVLEGVSKGKAWQAPVQAYGLDQKKCEFRPYLQAIPKGSKLSILNSDSVLHNIHTYELIGRARRTLFNIAQPKFKPKVTTIVRTRRGSAIRVECDAHNWMLGWIYVVDNPYYAIVRKDGNFTIKDIPAGTYKLKAWHPFLGTKEKKVNISTTDKVEVVFEYK